MEAERRVATVEAAKEQHVQTLKQMVFQIRCMQSRASEVMASLDELNGAAVRKLVEKEAKTLTSGYAVSVRITYVSSNDTHDGYGGLICVRYA